MEFDFQGLDPADQGNIKDAFADIPQLKHEIKCLCPEDNLKMSAQALDPLNTLYELKVNCSSCGIKQTIRHHTTPIS